jgi:hypothetical protein
VRGAAAPLLLLLRPADLAVCAAALYDLFGSITTNSAASAAVQQGLPATAVHVPGCSQGVMGTARCRGYACLQADPQSTGAM